MADNTFLDLEPPELTVLDTSSVGMHKDLDYLGKTDFKPKNGSNEKYFGKTESKLGLKRRILGTTGKNKVLAGSPDKDYIKPGSQMNEQTLYTGNVSVFE